MFVRNKFKYIYLLGGEPLLHPRAIDIIKIARKYFPNKDIRFLTNGLLLSKMSKEFFQTLIDYHIFLDIT
jgi:molybdenum cofactor biosynthesis enzyme MoaA